MKLRVASVAVPVLPAFACLVCVLSASLFWAQMPQIDDLNRQAAKLIADGKFPEARPLAEQALRMAEAAYPADDARISWPLENMALIDFQEKRYADAEALIERALRINEKALGPDHSRVAADRSLLEELRALERQTSEPPTISCAVNPSTIEPGESSTITAMGASPQNRPLTYSYAASEGSISGTGPSAAYSSSGASAGTVEILCNVSDDQGHTVSASADVTILAASAPPPHPAAGAPCPEGANCETAPGTSNSRPAASSASAASGGSKSSAGQHSSRAGASPHKDEPPTFAVEVIQGTKESSTAWPAEPGQRDGSEPSSSAPPASAPSTLTSLPQPPSASGGGDSPGVQYPKTTTDDFPDEVVEGDLARPGASSASSTQSQTKPPIVIHEVTLVGDESIERYPNIEAPDTVALGQEIAVQVSLTAEQIAPETRILSGEQHEGKLKLHMAAGEDQWTLTVNVTAPGLEFTRGGNTSEIKVTRDGDSTLAIFYLRPSADAIAQQPRRDTRILATLIHDGAFIARLSRPLTIVASMSAPPALSSATAPQVTHAAVPEAKALSTVAPPSAPRPGPAVRFDPDLSAPDITIVENRVGNTLRLLFFSPHTAPVEADIADPDALHAWIQTHYAQMALHGRGFDAVSDATQSAPQHAADYLNGFGSELYDKFAPQPFKDLFWKLIDNSSNHSPQNKHAQWVFESIQVFSDDPAIPWELMRPARADGTGRMDFLGLHFMIARWPLSTRGAARPPQSLTVSRSAVIAPAYRGAQQLPSAGTELATLRRMRGFTQVAGDYAAVRSLAMHPPQGVIHFAGHGAITEENGVPQFAILLEDSQMDPSTWQSLQSQDSEAHPLFFFNACDVGESRRFLNDVDGWAPVLLSSGASGYIGALWPVNDQAAEAVAASFYQHLSGSLSTSGSYVAMALAKARAEVFAQTGDPTALAYVFYGDPDLFAVSPESPATN